MSQKHLKHGKCCEKMLRYMTAIGRHRGLGEVGSFVQVPRPSCVCPTTPLLTFWLATQGDRMAGGTDAHWRTALRKGWDVSEVHFMGLHQMAVKAKSGVQISSVHRAKGRKGRSSICHSPGVTFLQVQASIHLNQKKYKTTWKLFTGSQECALMGQHAKLSYDSW